MTTPPPAREAVPVSPRRADRPQPGWLAELRDDLMVVLPSWLTARVLIALAYIVAVTVANHYVSGGRTQQMTEGLIAWDGTFYRDIARVGYTNLPAEALRFFPLFPLLARAFSVPLFGQVDLALILLANGLSLVAAVLVRRLVLFEKQDPVLAERAVWLTALFPSAFVLVWAYAESLFLVAAVGVFFAARRARFEIAAVLGLLAALSRPTGVLLAAAIAIEVVRQWRTLGLSDRLAGALAILAPPAGLALYLGWVGRNFGDPGLPYSVQSHLRGEEIDPFTRVLHGVGDLFGPERFGDALHLPFAIVFVALLIVVFRRWPVSYGVFATLMVVAALSAENLNSLERYALNAFPLMLGLATITAHPRVERVVLAVCGSGVMALAALSWLAVYVP